MKKEILKTFKKHYGNKEKSLMYEVFVDSKDLVRGGKLYNPTRKRSIDIMKLIRPGMTFKKLKKEKLLEYVLYLTQRPIQLMELTRDINYKDLGKVLDNMKVKNKVIVQRTLELRRHYDKNNKRKVLSSKR